MPRIATDPPEPKIINMSQSESLERHCAGELMDAVATKNVKAFRSAFEALILDCFEEEGLENE